MSKRLLVTVVVLLAGLTFSPFLRAQTAPSSATGDQSKPATWDSIPRSNPTTPEKNQPRPRNATSPASGTQPKPTAAANRAARSNTRR